MIICISGTLYAAVTYKATDVVYNASDGTSKNVSEALNELYENKNKNNSSVIYIPTLTFSSSCNASSSMGSDSSVSTNTVSVGSSTTFQFTFSIKEYSKLSIESGNCTYTLKDSTNTLPNKSGTLNNSDYVSTIGYDILVLSHSINCSGRGIGTHNSSASGSSASTLTNLRIE